MTQNYSFLMIAREFLDLSSQSGWPAIIFICCLCGVIGAAVADEETTLRNSWKHIIGLLILLFLLWWGAFFDGLWIRYE